MRSADTPFRFARAWIHAGKPYQAGDRASFAASIARMLAGMGAGAIETPATETPPEPAPAREAPAPSRRSRHRTTSPDQE